MKNLPTIVNLLTIARKYVALALIPVLFGGVAGAQLKADYTSNITAGCAPLVVQFTDSSAGNPNSWKWDLGNGTSSVFQNPSVAYFEPGSYTVTLTIKNSFGVDSVTKVNYITVYASPAVQFKASATSGCFPLATQFTDLSMPGSGQIQSWQWDFGDGNFSDEQNPTHTYTAKGNFNVSLRVTNLYGCVTSKTVNNFIQLETGVKADFSHTGTRTCNAPATIRFQNKSIGTGALSYIWDFGDGTTSNDANPSHVYTTPGNYNVSLIVSNGTGCTDTLVKERLITIGATTADFSVPEKVCEGSPTRFTNTSTPLPGSARWDFGDGTFSDSLHPIKAFTNAGNYVITMVSNNGACKDSVSKEITVISKPEISFFATDTVSCQAPFNVNFTNTTIAGSNFAAEAVTWFWSFGDGNTSNEKSPSHTYTKEGEYTVKLLVTNASGCTDSLVMKKYVRIKVPTAAITNLPKKGCAPLQHTFTSVINSIEPIVTYRWNFGDGNYSDSVKPTHVYTKVGVYDITLTYTTKSGCSQTVKVDRGIMVGDKPTAAYTANPVDVCAFVPVNFTDQSSGKPNEWIWFFGDGSSSAEQNPTHQYADTGHFNVTLIAVNNGCADTITIPKKIHVNPPVARFTFDRTCTVPRTIVFKDQSLGADKYSWSFGDGTTSSEKAPSHDYVSAGDYTVTLTVTNDKTGCSHTKTQVIRIVHEVAAFTISDTTVCRNAPVLFKAINSIPANVAAYTWRFGDGTTVNTKKEAISHAYTKSGTYHVTLIVKDIFGCVDSLTQQLPVNVYGPTTVFRSAVAGTCLNTAVNFIDSSYSDGIHEIIKWQWNWGDGNTEELQAGPFSHAYIKPGQFTVSLVVVDNAGCTDTLVKPKAVVISQPVAAFTADTLSCTTQAIKFKNASSGPALKYTWDFGDGKSSTERNPVHLYGSEGVYSISLSITDLYGCGASITKTNYVVIGNPVADFKVSDSTGTCPPLVVNFTNQSSNYSKWKWDFGDGSTSTERNPSHFYSQVGTFISKLTVYGPGGCVSEKTQTIKVDGPEGTFSYNTMIGCAPLNITFKAATQKNYSFVWDFDDGTTQSTRDSNIVHTYETPGVYLPKMILQDANGCSVPIKGADSIHVYGVLASYKHDGAKVCDSSMVSFSSTSVHNDAVVKYLWNFGDGTTSTSAAPGHIYTEAGEYQTSLKITTERGCTDSVSLPQMVKVNRTPVIDIAGDESACMPAVLNFNATLANPDTSTISWSWNFGNGNTYTQQTPPAQTFDAAGDYTVRAVGYSSNGCNDTATHVVSVHPLPTLDIQGETIVCAGSAQTLRVSGAATYAWTANDDLSCIDCANPVARPDSATTYFVRGTSAHGCQTVDSISVSVNFPFEITYSKPDTLCVGESIKLNASGAEKYSWYPSTGLNNPGIATPTATPGNTVTYQVIGADNIGCFTDTGYVAIKVYPMPEVNAGDDQTINVGRQTKIDPAVSADVKSVLWTPATGIVSRDHASVTVKPQETTEYTIEVKNEAGCAMQDKVTVFVLCNDANVFVPNTFSPNGDGANDVFFPRGSGLFKVQNLKVFNRWGEVVFERSNFNANDASSGWDGTYKGKQLSPDVFVYVMQVVCENNSTLSYNGNVALIK